jgi:hypothetical protein
MPRNVEKHQSRQRAETHSRKPSGGSIDRSAKGPIVTFGVGLCIAGGLLSTVPEVRAAVNLVGKIIGGNGDPGISESTQTPVPTKKITEKPAAKTTVTPKKTVNGCTEFSPEILRWSDIVLKYAQKYIVVPEKLIFSVIDAESDGITDAYSESGAVGLMQVMPRDGIAKSYTNVQKTPYFTNRPSMAELYDPDFNVNYGTMMLANLIKKYDDYQKSNTLGWDIKHIWREALKDYGPADIGYDYADEVLKTYETKKLSCQSGFTPDNPDTNQSVNARQSLADFARGVVFNRNFQIENDKGRKFIQRINSRI